MRRPLQRWIERVWESPSGEEPRTSCLLIPMETLYRLARSIRRPTVLRAPIPVVSIGSLWVGGAGKTPLAAAVARLAQEIGKKPCIVLRGYRGRVRRGVRQVLPSPDEAAHEIYGDEAILHARRGTAPVYVAPRRIDGVEQGARDGCDLAILDDGMQHHRLARDLEIVALPGQRPFGNRRLLPRGPLREPVASLARADLVVLAHRDGRTIEEALREEIHRLAPEAELLSWQPLLRLRPLLEGDAPFVPPSRPGPVALLSGIARGAAFRCSVERLGYRVAWSESFPDHHRFSRKEINEVAGRAEREGISAVVTTEKDAVRIDRGLDLDTRRFWVAELEIAWNEANAETRLRERLRALRDG